MRKTKAILYALLAAAFYAVNVPFSKLLLVHVGPTSSHEPLCLALQVFGLRRWLASSSPIRATARMGSLSKLSRGFRSASPRRAAAWRGSHYSNASLLGNFEIVATTVIALAFFKEAASRRHWAAIGLITLSSILLSFEGTDSLRFSTGSLFALLARYDQDRKQTLKNAALLTVGFLPRSLAMAVLMLTGEEYSVP